MPSVTTALRRFFFFVSGLHWWRPFWGPGAGALRVAAVAWLVAAGLGLAPSRTRAQALAQPVLNYADWQLSWAEEFAGRSDSVGLRPRWQFDYPWAAYMIDHPDLRHMRYAPVALAPDSAHGRLNLVTHRLDPPRPRPGHAPLQYTAGMLFTRDAAPAGAPATAATDGFVEGLFELRARLPHYRTEGVAAFWLYSPLDEVDIFESGRNYFFSTTTQGLDSYRRPSLAQARSCSCFFFNADTLNLDHAFHTYTLAWKPGELVFYFDGHPLRHETRYPPNNVALPLIINNFVYAWAQFAQDTFALDYVRVYRPRQPAPLAPWRPSAYTIPPQLPLGPVALDPAALDPASRQLWAVAGASGQPAALRLRLTDNRNPLCAGWLPLPHLGADGWAPPWVLLEGSPMLEVTFAALPGPVQWTLTNLQGQAVASGTALPDHPWTLPVAALEPGSYWVQLRQNEAQIRHPLVVLGRPSYSRPSPAFEALDLAPPPPTEP